MDTVQIDLFTVVIAAVLNMVIGFLWYSKWIFGPMWMKLHQMKKDSCGDKSCLIYSGIVSLVIAYFLSFFEAYLGVTSITDGMFIGFCLWIGFVATTQISSVIWLKAPWKLFLLDTGCKLLSFLVMGGVIGA